MLMDIVEVTAALALSECFQLIMLLLTYAEDHMLTRQVQLHWYTVLQLQMIFVGSGF